MAASLFLGGLAFLFAVVWGAPLIRLLRAKRVGKQIRIEGPQTEVIREPPNSRVQKLEIKHQDASLEPAIAVCNRNLRRDRLEFERV